jgi:hypothetical protein
MEDYQAEFDKRFKDDPIANFVKDFRNYCQHYKMPRIGSSVLFEGEKNDRPRSVLNLSKTDLLQYGRWRANSKKYLKEQPEQISVVTFVDKYYDNVMSFVNWFRAKQGIIHGEECRKVNAMQKAIDDRLLSELVPTVRARWQLFKGGNSLQSLEQAFVSYLSAEEWKELDANDSDLCKRCDFMIKTLKKKDVTDDEFLEELRLKYDRLNTKSIG